MSEFFQGNVRHVRIHPFVLRKWEQRIMYRSYAITAGGDPVTTWRDLGGSKNHAIYPNPLPLWFRAWLWLRTKWAHLKRLD